MTGARPFCFNPCSGGSIALGRIQELAVRVPCPVSILVLVEVLPWDRWPSAIGYAPSVSILVLVEVLPWEQEEALREMERQDACFNPCSGGSIALGSNTSLSMKLTLSVSILVLVEVLPWESEAYPYPPPPPVSILVLVEVLPWV